MKRARLIMNPIAGDDEPNPMKLPEIVSALEAHDIRVDLAFTSPDASPEAIARLAVEEGYDLVIASGGDGTVSEVAKGLIHASVPLGILPVGTYNNIARSLNLPIEVDAACQVIAQGQVKAIDVGQANDGQLFFEAAGVGLDAVLFPLGEEIKGGRWGRMLQAIRLTMAYQPQRLKILLDRSIAEARQHPVSKRRFLQGRSSTLTRELSLSALLVVIANGPFYGVGFTVAPNAVIDDGLLTISVYRNFSKWELLRHFWSISKGQYHYSPKLETYHASEVRLTSDVQLPVHVDGKAVGNLPATFKVIKQALSVMVPAIATPNYNSQKDSDPPVALPIPQANA